MSKKGIISLLGCGWLGFPLAKSLISRDFTVMATTTTKSKLEVFRAVGIDPFLVQFSSAVQIPDVKKIFTAETLVITIPPGRKDPNGFGNYKRMIQIVCDELSCSKVKKLILISSTSVYPDNNELVDEYSKIFPSTESGQLMANTERVLANQNVDMISLRLAGLIGPGRFPGRFFAGKTKISNGLAPVNLIHLDDAIGILHRLIEDENVTGIFNGCAPDHPTKKEFYSLATELEGLEKPGFLSEKTSWKIVSSSRLRSELNYRFEYPSLMDWLHSM